MIQVSFIIPVYNATPYIQKCLDSIFALGISEEKMEIICVNDCSLDNTAEVITEIAKEHPSVVLLSHTENKRQGGGSNTAIRTIRGAYAIFMDQDDIILPYDLLGKIRYMRENNLELLLGRVVCRKSNGQVSYWNSRQIETSIMTGPEFFEEEMINRVCFGAVWMGIYKTELLKRVEPFVENKIYEDTDWCYRCTYAAQKVQYLPFDMYEYQNNPNSFTHNIPVQYLVWRLQQSFRMWYWALQTKDHHKDVMISVEDYCVWNSRGTKILWKYGMADRHYFFQSFSKDDYAQVKQWKMNGGAIWVLRYPLLGEIGMCIIAPCAQLTKKIKDILKQLLIKYKIC